MPCSYTTIALFTGSLVLGIRCVVQEDWLNG
ncbi:hypothetical protein Mcate_00311 [Meiothermus taiwanensis]|jgi:hypothetical protein|uniref:Uncharacterized protein n=1 Tax=Meiothermus taiwanensis TaxID=172827 RepID=A0A399E6C7_9DEIN|nr:hypothetical protein Mcate_00311 [Meiothermus taiwanensis]